jgi:hypothetical protein
MKFERKTSQRLFDPSFVFLASSFPNAGSSNRRTAPFEGADVGAIPAPAANFRLVVK